MISHLQDHLKSGRHSPGVLIVRPEQKISTLVKCLVLIAHAGERSEFTDAVHFIP